MIDVICVSYHFEEGAEYIQKLLKIHNENKNINYILVYKLGENNISNTNNLKIIKQDGSGIYNAMNKGYLEATGKWIIFSNVGDTLKKIPKKLFPNYVINAYPVDIYDAQGRFIYTRKLQKKMPSHQGMFINKELLGNKPIFNENYNYAADLDFYLRNKKSCLFINTSSVSDFYLGGVSTQKSTFLRRRLERLLILLRNFRKLFLKEEWLDDIN